MRYAFFHRFSALAALLTLPACALLNAQGKPADTLYVLHASASSPAATVLPVSLMVALPEAAPGLNTKRIAVLDSPNRLTYYTGVAWPEPLPRVWQDMVVDALRQGRAFASVNSDKDPVLADNLLTTDIRDFQVEDSASNPQVRLRLAVTLTNANSHRVIAAFTVEKTAAANANRMEAIAMAFNEAANAAAGDINQQIGAALPANVVR